MVSLPKWEMNNANFDVPVDYTSKEKENCHILETG